MPVMEAEITAALIGAGAGLVVGVPALWLAVRANGKSAAAVSEAKTANKHAAEAVEEARKANALAAKANSMSEKSLTATLGARWAITARAHTALETPPVVLELTHYGSAAVTDVELELDLDPTGVAGGERKWASLVSGEAAVLELESSVPTIIAAWLRSRGATVRWTDPVGDRRSQALNVPHPYPVTARTEATASELQV